jgi:hypothetical protein
VLRRTLTAIAAVAMVAVSAPAAAHRTIQVQGRVAELSKGVIAVHGEEGMFVATITPGTRVLRGEKLLTLKDVKVGEVVTLIGYGDTGDDMLAVGIVLKDAR